MLRLDATSNPQGFTNWFQGAVARPDLVRPRSRPHAAQRLRSAVLCVCARAGTLVASRGCHVLRRMDHGRAAALSLCLTCHLPAPPCLMQVLLDFIQGIHPGMRTPSPVGFVRNMGRTVPTVVTASQCPQLRPCELQAELICPLLYR